MGYPWGTGSQTLKLSSSFVFCALSAPPPMIWREVVHFEGLAKQWQTRIIFLQETIITVPDADVDLRGNNLNDRYRFHCLGIGNGGGKQGRGNQPPYRRYGPDTEIQYRPRKPHGPAKSSRILSKREADTESQCRPHFIDADTIVDAVFADAISETSVLKKEVSPPALQKDVPKKTEPVRIWIWTSME